MLWVRRGVQNFTRWLLYRMGWEYNVAFMPYGDWWRRHIRAMHQFFNSRAVLAFEPIQEKSRRYEEPFQIISLLNHSIKIPAPKATRGSSKFLWLYSTFHRPDYHWCMFPRQDLLPICHLTAIKTLYAIEVKPKGDRFIEIVHIALEGIGKVILPGLWAIDIFPKREY